MNKKSKSRDELFNETLERMLEPFEATGTIPSLKARFGIAVAATYRANKEYQKQQKENYNERI